MHKTHNLIASYRTVVFSFTPLLSPKRLQFTFSEQSFVAALRHYHVPATCYGAKKNWQIWIGASVIRAQPSLLLAIRHVISSYSSPWLKHCSWFTFASTATCVVTLWPSFIRMLWVKKKWIWLRTSYASRSVRAATSVPVAAEHTAAAFFKTQEFQLPQHQENPYILKLSTHSTEPPVFFLLTI